MDYSGLAKCVQEGDTIYVDDGLINLTVQSTQGQDVITTVMNNASLGQQKGVNMPGIVTELPSVTEQDVKDLRFCVQQGVDIVDVNEFTQLCIYLFISLPHLPPGFKLRQVPRQVRYRLLSCPQ